MSQSVPILFLKVGLSADHRVHQQSLTRLAMNQVQGPSRQPCQERKETGTETGLKRRQQLQSKICQGD